MLGEIQLSNNDNLEAETITGTLPLSNDEYVIRCEYEAFFRCRAYLRDHSGKQLCAEYSINRIPDKYRPFGIKSVLRNSENIIIDYSVAENKFATADECIKTIEMFAQNSIMPCSVNNVI